jgi:hypothetical protein
MKEPRKPHFARDLRDRRPPAFETFVTELLMVAGCTLIVAAAFSLLG